jgi:hypothetical protein
VLVCCIRYYIALHWIALRKTGKEIFGVGRIGAEEEGELIWNRTGWGVRGIGRRLEFIGFLAGGFMFEGGRGGRWWRWWVVCCAAG